MSTITFIYIYRTCEKKIFLHLIVNTSGIVMQIRLFFIAFCYFMARVKKHHCMLVIKDLNFDLM